MTCPHCDANEYRKWDNRDINIPFYKADIVLTDEDGDKARLYACPECCKTFIVKVL